MKIKFKKILLTDLYRVYSRPCASYTTVSRIAKLFNSPFLLMSFTALDSDCDLLKEILNNAYYIVHLPLRNSIVSETTIYLKRENMELILEKAFHQKCRDICVYGFTEDIESHHFSYNSYTLDKDILYLFKNRIVDFRMCVNFDETDTTLTFSKLWYNKEFEEKIKECFDW